MPARLTIGQLLDGARASRNPDLDRLAREYLPLTFSRRHGDPSRPWNRFEIALRDENGEPQLSFQGNWRDIFQNWEALAWSFPEYLESMVAVFLDATTADGYNPYRISRSGVDWEIPEPDNPWANIGYWSDHQIIYLLRLLETSARFHPGRLQGMLDSAIFTHADVPYRIAQYDQILVDPFETITFDEAHAELIDERVAVRGADGRLVHGLDGELVRVTLAEKLLLLLLAKVVNLVPDGGIWMNTQRPEWNDANNALVGRGLSVVTLAQLRRYVEFVRGLITSDTHVTEEFADLLGDDLAGTGGPSSTPRRGLHGRHAPDIHGRPGEARLRLPRAGLRRVLRQAHRGHRRAGAVDARRGPGLRRCQPDGEPARRRPVPLLQHPRPLRRCGPDPATARDARGPGRDAVQRGAGGAGVPRPALRAACQRPLPRGPAQLHAVPGQGPARIPRSEHVHARPGTVLPPRRRPGGGGDRSLVVADGHGALHFASGVRNARDVEEGLDRLAADPDLGEVARDSRAELLDIFEEVFTHAKFTGRSGSFFAYEGLGSIYWHMVSKLLLAVQETVERAVADNEPSATVRALLDAYEDVRAGLGYSKPAEVYGAFPADPYSHTPAGHGARQPGMTGQVKEEVLTRLGELGLRVEGGQIVFRPIQLRETEWRQRPGTFEYVDVLGDDAAVDLPVDSLAFTFCQVPVVYLRADALGVRVVWADGTSVDCAAGRIPAEVSASIFERRGEVHRIEVRTPGAL